MSDMADRIAAVMGRLETAKIELLGTGQSFDVGANGRAPVRSDRFRDAQKAIHLAEQARARLLVEVVGDADAVPLEVAQQFGLTGRAAVHIITTARTGSALLRDHVFGQQDPLAVNLDD
ncbi:hypothetical protein ACTWPB_07740 [Nocardia sp. IBHARD005]|uniref:hypothetical protein n=1 Tax=Nocardia sp. IBHARD005 TaxID=3457765 RepID=UPI004059CA10